MKIEAAQRLRASKSADAYFSPKAIGERAHVKYKGRDKLVSMKIADFLALALPGGDHEKEARVQHYLTEKIQFETLPYLYYDWGGGAYAKCSGHEGRHRARALQALGLEYMPVELRGPIRWSEQEDPVRFDYREDWPEVLISENGAHRIPFPVKRVDANKTYQGH